jgi:hypothetical protein
MTKRGAPTRQVASRKLPVRGRQVPIEEIRASFERNAWLMYVHNMPRAYLEKDERAVTLLPKEVIDDLRHIEEACAQLELLGLGLFKNRGRTYVPRFVWHVGNVPQMLDGTDTAWRREEVPPDAFADRKNRLHSGGGPPACSIRSRLYITPEQLQAVARDMGVEHPGRKDLTAWANEILAEHLLFLK